MPRKQQTGRQGDRQMMYFKFVSFVPLYTQLVDLTDKEEMEGRAESITCDGTQNFLLQADRAKYFSAIIWSKKDLERRLPMPLTTDQSFPIGSPPEDEDAYPIEVKIVQISKPDDALSVTHQYYGFDCALYVMNDQGTTLDKLHRSHHGLPERVDIAPPPDPWDEKIPEEVLAQEEAEMESMPMHDFPLDNDSART